MARLLREELMPHVRRVQWRGRAGSVLVRTRIGEKRVQLLVVGWHGAHAELASASWADVAALAAERPRGCQLLTAIAIGSLRLPKTLGTRPRVAKIIMRRSAATPGSALRRSASLSGSRRSPVASAEGPSPRPALEHG